METNEDTGGPPVGLMLETAERLRALAVAYPLAATIPRDDVLSEASRLEVCGNGFGAAVLRNVADLEFNGVRVSALVRHADEVTRAVGKRAGELTDAAGILREMAARLTEVADGKGNVHVDHLIVERAAHDDIDGNNTVVVALSGLIHASAGAPPASRLVPLHSLTFHAGRLESLAVLRTPQQDDATRAREAAHDREVGRSNAVTLWKLTPDMVKALKSAGAGRIENVAQPVARALARRGFGETVSTRSTNGSREFPRSAFVLNSQGMGIAMSLRPDCAHGYGPMDSCPGCASDEEAAVDLHAPTLRYVADFLVLRFDTVRYGAKDRVVDVIAHLRAMAADLESGADGA